MINKIGYKLILLLLISYTLTMALYLFFIINVLSHRSCIVILAFSFLGIAVDYAALILGKMYINKLGAHTVGDISVITLLYTLMQFFTVVFARNFLETWQYALFQGMFLVLYLVSVLPKLIISLRNNK